jgi:SNF2 family DNA or RNA helicase
MSIRIEDLDQIEDQGLLFCVVEEDSRYPQQLMVQGLDQDVMIRQYSPAYLSRYSVLNETGMWHELENKLEDDGFTVYLLPSAVKVLETYARWSEPLVVDNYTLPDKSDGSPGTLYPFQQYGLRKAFDSPNHYFFFNWGTGTGKGTAASAGAQQLFNEDKIDLVYVFTLKKMKINLTREFNAKTILKARNIEGTKAYREKEFAKEDAQVYVMNYEKANFDYLILANRLKKKRVLFILDEVQKILTFTGNTSNKAGQGVRKLIRTSKRHYAWGMSATVIGKNPERFWRLFDIPEGVNPLGRLGDFRREYCDEIITRDRRWGQEQEYVWNPIKLTEVRHRIAPWSHSVRKDDPGIRDLFKETQFIPVPYQLSEEDRTLYDFVLNAAAEDKDRDNWGEYYRVLRYISMSAESLKYSNSELAQILVEAYPDLTSDTSACFEAVLDLVEKIQDQDDKVVMFCSFTNLELFLLSKQMNKRNIKHVIHYGTGMSDKEAQKAQDDFKADPSIVAFLSSDAGSHGLSFQEARYVINVDLPYSQDILIQRNNRIHRVDSYLDDLTMYGFYAENTVQERIWEINNERRSISAIIQGTSEELSNLKPEIPESENLGRLLGIV